MYKRLPQKIREAIRRGDLIPREKVLASFTAEEQEEIREIAQQIKLAMRLRRLRKKLKLSQENLAKKMDVKREFISRIESGEQNVTLQTLYKIAEATGREFHFGFR